MNATSAVTTPRSDTSHGGPELPTSIRLFLGAATALVGIDELPGVDAHALVTMFRRKLKLPDSCPWDATFVQHVGHCSHFDHQRGESNWPLPVVASSDDLLRVAHELDLIRSEPEPADIYTMWSDARRRFVRTGIIISVRARRVQPDGQSYYECVTLEGDLNGRAGSRGSFIRCVRRRLSAEFGDCFIRWTDVGASDASNAGIAFAA